jgi:hypothetical protein
MGSYIYSVRTKSIETPLGTVYALAYLTKPSWDFGRVDGRSSRLVAAAESVWERRGEKPGLVHLTYDDKNKPCDGDPVFEWDGRATDWDEPSFKGAKSRLGFLRSRKVGRKTVWTVEPVKYDVSVGTMRVRYGCCNMLFVRENSMLFSLAEAVAWAKANLQPGEESRILTHRATDTGKSAMERVAAPSEEAVDKVVGRLTTGPWPAHMLTADEEAAANELVAEGKALLSAEKYEGDSEEPPYWHGRINYKATVRMLSLKASTSKLEASLESERVVFKGGEHGEHSLDRLSSSPERIRIHWQGYCENNGAQAL